MKEQLITFGTAKIAKEKGFDIACIDYFTPLTHKLESYTFCIKSNSLSDNISAPTQSLLQKWLREEHSLHMEIFLSDNSPYTGYYYRVMTIGQYFTTSHDGILSDKFEYALEKGLQEALKLIK